MRLVRLVRLVEPVNKRLMGVASMALVGTVVLAGCGSEAAEEEAREWTRVPVTYDAAAQGTPADGGEPDPGEAAAATEVTVDMAEMYFEPAEFSIPAGTEVTINLTNSGVAIHDFTVEALGINEVLDPGGETSITVTADAGDYDYICTQPGHKEAGMVGVMSVLEEGAEAAEGGASPVASPGASPGASPVATPAGEEAAEDEDAATELTVDMAEMFFEPTEFSIPAGTDVTIRLTNSGVSPHDFTIEELGINEVLDPGAETTITINAEAGTYDYICTQPGHKEAGMVGVMTVQ